MARNRQSRKIPVSAIKLASVDVSTPSTDGILELYEGEKSFGYQSDYSRRRCYFLYAFNRFDKKVRVLQSVCDSFKNRWIKEIERLKLECNTNPTT